MFRSTTGDMTAVIAVHSFLLLYSGPGNEVSFVYNIKIIPQAVAYDHTTGKATSSRLITEVKTCRAGLALGWVTALERPVL